MLRNFSALVICHTLARIARGMPLSAALKPYIADGCRGGIHLHQHQVVTGALHQDAYGRGVGLTLDQVALPVPRDHPVFNFRRGT